jgi:hypothetical protein
MYKRPMAYICENGNQRKIKDHMEVIFNHGWTPVATNLLYRNIVDKEIAEDRKELDIMSKVLMRKSRIMFVCGKDITEEMKDEMVYAKSIGLIVVPLSGIVQIEEYLRGDE